MRKFIIKLFVFLVPVLALAVGGDFLISLHLKKSNTYAAGEYATWNDIYAGALNAEIFIYGSSRAVVQISPAILQETLGKSCYNLGIDGHNFWAQYFRHQEVSKHNKKPQTIIQTLDITTLSDRGQLYNAQQFLPYMFYHKSIETFTKPYQYFSYFDFRLPMLRYLGNRTAITHALKLMFIDQPAEYERVNGYSGQEISWRNDLENAQKKMTFYKATVDSTCLSLFEGYLQECLSEDINLVLVYTPEYYEGQHFVKNRNELFKLYKTLSTKYNIPLLDYSTDSISYDRSFFYNSGHLNKRGSELFSHILAEDLKEIITK